MDIRKQRLLAIVGAFEAVRIASPAAGPAWSVAFKDEHDHLLVALSLQSYQQVDALARDVGALGFALTILDAAEDGNDFVFRPHASADQGTLLRTDSPARHAPQQGIAPVRPRIASRGALEQGALVMQDTGGPVMLLSALSRDLAYCVWFSETAEARSGTFTVSRLVNIDAARRLPAAPGS